jgi:hypothetical protein
MTSLSDSLRDFDEQLSKWLANAPDDDPDLKSVEAERAKVTEVIELVLEEEQEEAVDELGDATKAVEAQTKTLTDVANKIATAQEVLTAIGVVLDAVGQVVDLASGAV